MADKKISALTASTTPLAGSEVLPIVQGGSTVKVSVDNLTAGKSVPASKVDITTGADALSVYIRGRSADNASNIFFNNNADTAQYGFINATASEFNIASIGARPLSLGAAGSTAFQVNTTGNLVVIGAGKGIDFSANGGDVLTQYDEGTWTTTVTGVTNFTGTPTLASGKYTRVGRLVTIEGKFSGTVTTGSTNTYFQFTLPISRGAATDGGAGSVFSNSNLKLGGIYNASADTTTAYLAMPSTSAQPSGADTFFFSYSYYA